VFSLRTFWEVALQATGTLVVGGVAFVVVAILVKSEEFTAFKSTAVRKFWKRGEVIPGANEVQMQ
ncbi:MAG: hypothetical protein V1745_01805, partial [Patescibacteria group bacterium]